MRSAFTWLSHKHAVGCLPDTQFAVGAQRGGTTHLPSATARPHPWRVGDTALAARPRTPAVQNRGANFQSASRQRATICGTSCRRRWPSRSVSSAVSKYQPPSRAAHQAVYCWQPCFSGCRSSSLERSVRDRPFQKTENSTQNRFTEDIP